MGRMEVERWMFVNLNPQDFISSTLRAQVVSIETFDIVYCRGDEVFCGGLNRENTELSKVT